MKRRGARWRDDTRRDYGDREREEGGPGQGGGRGNGREGRWRLPGSGRSGEGRSEASFGEALCFKAGDSQDKALTLPANPIFTHLLLDRIRLPPEREVRAKHRNATSLGGRESTGLPSLVRRPRERERERRSLSPAPAPRGPCLRHWTGVMQAFLRCWGWSSKERTKPPLPALSHRQPPAQVWEAVPGMAPREDCPLGFAPV